MPEYLFPFGIDATKYFQGLQQIDEGTENLANNIATTNKELQKSFDNAATAGDKLGRTIDVDASKLKNLRDQAGTLGKELGNALNGNNVGAGIEARVEKLKQSLATLGGKKIAFNFDEAKLRTLEKLLESGAEDFRVLAASVDIARDAIAQLDPNSAEFAELSTEINQAETFLNEMGATAEQVTTKNKSLKVELRELKAAMAEMELAGNDTGDEFLRMAIRAGELEDQIGDVSARVRVLASDTKYVDAGISAITGLAGAFTAAQGAAALFGDENQELNEALQKVTGAMAILQGIQAIQNALNKDGALSVLLSSRAQTTAAATTATLATATTAEAGATVAATAATRGFTAALLANPILLIVAGVVAAFAAFNAFTSGSEDAEEATEALNRALEQLDRQLNIDISGIEQATDLRISYAKKAGATEAEINRIGIEGLRQRAAAQKAFTEQLDAENEKALKNGAKYEDYIKGLQKAEDANRDYLKTLTEIQVTENNNTAKANEDRKKAGEKSLADQKEINTKRIAQAQEAAQKEREIEEQIIKFRREITAAYIDRIEDGSEKEKQRLIEAANNRIEDLNREKILSAKAAEERNKLITQIQKNLTVELRAIDKQREEDRAVLLFDAQKKSAELQAEGLDRELALLALTHKEREKQINEQFKNEGALRVNLLRQLEAQTALAEKKLRDDAATRALKEQEERAVLEIETAAQFIDEAAGTEEQKQVAVLAVKLDYARKAYELILSQGNAENSLVALQGLKQVQDLEKQLNGAIDNMEKAGEGFDLFGFLKLDDEQKAALQETYGAIQSLMDFAADQYQRQIDKKQEVIDQETEEIERLEQQLDEEKQLREDGLANNVAHVEAELAEKKRQREEDIRQQEELQKKQQLIQKVQLGIDTATQASSLITSAANIFKALSSIPFVGVPLAIAAIGLMTGAFVTAKIRAFQAIGDGQKQSFGKGGTVDGKSHSQGGKKYFAEDGSGDVVELEGGEFVTNKSASNKYGELLEAINEDRLSKMDETALGALLRGLGINTTIGEQRDAVTIIHEHNAQSVAQTAAGDVSNDIKEINRNVGYLADKKRFTPEIETIGKVTYKRVGNRLTIIREK